MQPLKKLREFRLAPEGPMRKEFKESPIFGVNAGVVKSVCPLLSSHINSVFRATSTRDRSSTPATSRLLSNPVI